ncbi:MAG TPA: MFS transporter [Hyphomonadaceae bacterium]|nr:MFS transporter [Hyphomonadaceae bacterium]HPN04191.1 MFS transporter [Hyphomonadaceae bacterium]
MAQHKTTKRLSLWSMIAFASPGLPATLLIVPVFGILPTYYSLNTKIGLAEIGTAFLIARIIDALLDPLIGILSDRTRSRLGARLPWMIAGAVIALPSGYFLFLPPADADIYYFFWSSFMVMVAWTLLSIPHGAWAAELSDDYDERSRIFGWKSILATAGSMSFFLLPLAVAPFTHSTEFQPPTMFALMGVLTVLLPATLVWAGISQPRSQALGAGAVATTFSLKAVLRSVVANRPFLLFVGITTLAGVSMGMTTTLSFLYMQDYLGVGDYAFLLGMLPALVGIASTPLWLRLSKRIDKHRTWAIGLGLSAIVGLFILALPPGRDSLIALGVILTTMGALQGAGIALPSAILADVADYEKWKEKANATGNYFALLTLLSKGTTAIGAAIALYLSDALGYIPRARGGTGDYLALMTPFVIVPTVLTLLACVLIVRFPIDRRRHRLIMRRLEARDRQAAAATAAP